MKKALLSLSLIFTLGAGLVSIATAYDGANNNNACHCQKCDSQHQRIQMNDCNCGTSCNMTHGRTADKKFHTNQYNAQGSSLVYAAERGNVEEVRNYLNGGANPNVLNATGERTLLHDAVMNDQVEIVRLLLERGANPNEDDAFGRTPLHDAVYYDRVAIVKYLLQHGANPNMVDKDGYTALHYATRYDHDATQRLLRQYGASEAGELRRPHHSRY